VGCTGGGCAGGGIAGAGWAGDGIGGPPAMARLACHWSDVSDSSAILVGSTGLVSSNAPRRATVQIRTPFSASETSAAAITRAAGRSVTFLRRRLGPRNAMIVTMLTA
jgi:hypothetical protein